MLLRIFDFYYAFMIYDIRCDTWHDTTCYCMMLNIILTTSRQSPCPKGHWKGGSRSYVVIPSKPGMNGTRMKTDPSSQVPVGSIKGKFESFGMANFTTGAEMQHRWSSCSQELENSGSPRVPISSPSSRPAAQHLDSTNAFSAKTPFLIVLTRVSCNQSLHFHIRSPAPILIPPS